MMDFLSDLSDGIGNAGNHISDLLKNVIGIGGDQQQTANASQTGLPQQAQRPDTPPQGGQLPDTPQRPGQAPVNNAAQAVQQVQQMHQDSPEFQHAISTATGVAQQVQQENPDASPQQVTQSFRDRLNDMMADKPWYSSRPMRELLFNFGISMLSGRDLGASLAAGAIAAHRAHEADQRAPEVMQMADQLAKNGEMNPQSEAALMEYVNTGNAAALHDVKMSDLQKMQRTNNEWSRRNAVTFDQSEQQNAEQYEQQRNLQQNSFANQAMLQQNSFANQRTLQDASEARAEAREDRQFDRQLQMYGIKQAYEQQQKEQEQAQAQQQKAQQQVQQTRKDFEQAHAAFENPAVAAVLNGDSGAWDILTDNSAARQSAKTQLYESLMLTEQHLNGGKAVPKLRQREIKEETDDIFSRGASQAVTRRRINSLKMTVFNNMLSTADGLPGDVKREARAALNENPDNLKMVNGHLMYKRNGKWNSW